MSSRKALKRSKRILLAIDLILLAVAIAGGLYCGNWIFKIESVKIDDYESTIAHIAYEEAKIDDELNAARPQIEAMEAECAQKLEEAKVEREAALSELNTAIAQRDELQQQLDDMTALVASFDTMEQQIADLRVEYGLACRQLEEMIEAGESDLRICYLTFDDGPAYKTGEFLDELKRLDVKATFFTIGIGLSEKEYWLRDAYLKRQAREGHAIANHTYTHAFNGSLYKSVDNFITAVKQQDEVVYAATGMHTDIVRFPAGSYYNYYRKSSIAALHEMGYEWIDWLGNAYDSGTNGAKRSPTSIANAVIRQARQVDIYVGLMHDWNGNTLKALDKIVTTLREEGYIFLPLFKESITMGDNTSPRWDN